MDDTTGSPNNKAKVLCTMTQSEEFVRLCVYRRNRKWRGKGSGSDLCDCAMDAGKCLVARMMTTERSAKMVMFFSATDKVIAAPKDVVNNVSAVIATGDMLSKYPMLTTEERERLSTATINFDGQPKKGKGKIKAQTASEQFSEAVEKSV